MCSFACKKCGETFTKNCSLSRHKKTCYDTNSDGYPCINCLKRFTCRDSLLKHIQKGRCKSDATYNQCEKVFKSPWYLKRHLKVHSKKKVWSCCVCIKSYKKEDHYFKHIYSHEECVPDIINIDHLTHNLVDDHTEEFDQFDSETSMIHFHMDFELSSTQQEVESNRVIECLDANIENEMTQFELLGNRFDECLDAENETNLSRCEPIDITSIVKELKGGAFRQKKETVI